jgi:hypothetical protein
MLIKLITFFLWIGVSASGVYWGIPLTTSHPDTNPAPVALTPESQGNWSAVLGEKRTPPELSKPSISANQFKLLGLAAATKTGQNQGVALITFQDQSARSYKVGSKINDKLVVLDLSKQKVTIGLAKDPKNEKEHIYLEAALLPQAKSSKEPPSGTKNAPKFSYSSPNTMQPSQPGYTQNGYDPMTGYAANPTYNDGGASSYPGRSYEPPMGRQPGIPPSAYNPEIGGTPGYPSPPPTGTPMY